MLTYLATAAAADPNHVPTEFWGFLGVVIAALLTLLGVVYTERNKARDKATESSEKARVLAEEHAEAMAKAQAEKEASDLEAMQAQAHASVKIEQERTAAKAELASNLKELLTATHTELKAVREDQRELRMRVEKLEEEKRQAQNAAAKLAIENGKLTAKVEALELEVSALQSALDELQADRRSRGLEELPVRKAVGRRATDKPKV